MNIATALTMAAEAYPERVAIVDPDRSWTYGELLARAGALAARVPAEVDSVSSIGLTGSHVATCLFGAAIAGRSYAPLNHRLPVDQLLALADRLEPTVVAAGHAWMGAVVAHGARVLSSRDIAAPSVGPPTSPVDDPVRPAVLLYTSGTTSAPKAAVLGHDNLFSYLVNTLEFASAAEDETLLVAVPSFHIAGVAALLSSVWTGRRMVVLDRFSGHGWLELARRAAVTHAFVVPTMLARIVDAADGAPAVPSLRNLAYGGARTPLPVLERALELFPHTSFVNAYGLTETSSTIAVLGPGDHRAAIAGDPVARRRLASVGRPMPGVEIDIIGEDGSALPAGEVGHVRIRGPQVSGRYLTDAHDGGAEPGVLTTGDLGHVDEDGYLFIAGRGDDVVIRGGENIAPAEVEDALLRHPAVEQAVVVGIPDIEWGERLAASVVLRSGAQPVTPDDLRAHTRAILGGLKCPGVIEFVSSVPLTASGKVLRREVRRALIDGQAGRS